jgi:hypothetical protein
MTNNGYPSPRRLDNAPLTPQILRDAIESVEDARALHCGMFVKFVLISWGMDTDNRFRVGDRDLRVSPIYHLPEDVINILGEDGQMLGWLWKFSARRADYPELPDWEAA